LEIKYEDDESAYEAGDMAQSTPIKKLIQVLNIKKFTS